MISWFNISLLGVFMVVPILPAFVRAKGSVQSLGIVVTAGNLSVLLGTLVVSKLSEKFGRRLVLLCSVFLTSLGSILTGTAANIGSLIAFRFISGFGGVTVLVVQVVIADLTIKSERPRYLAILGLMQALAFIIGPTLGSAISSLGLAVPFYVCGGLAGFVFLGAVIFLEETHHGI